MRVRVYGPVLKWACLYIHFVCACICSMLPLVLTNTSLCTAFYPCSLLFPVWPSRVIQIIYVYTQSPWKILGAFSVRFRCTPPFVDSLPSVFQEPLLTSRRILTPYPFIVLSISIYQHLGAPDHISPSTPLRHASVWKPSQRSLLPFLPPFIPDGSFQTD